MYETPVEKEPAAISLEELAKTMEKSKAVSMYNSLRGILAECQIASSCAGIGGGIFGGENYALPHIRRVAAWTEYFAQRELKYKSEEARERIS